MSFEPREVREQTPAPEPPSQEQGNAPGADLAALLAQEAAGASEAFKSRTDAALQEVVGRLGEARTQAQAAAAETGTALGEVVSSAEGTLSAAVERERAAFITAVTQTRSAATLWGQQAGQQASQVVTDVQARATALGTTYGEQAKQTEQQAIAEKYAEAEQIGAEATAIGEEKAGSASGGEEAASAKGKAARELASKAKDTIVDGVRTAMEDVKGADELATKWAEQTRQFAEGLRATAEPAVQQLNEAGASVATAVEQAGTDGTTTITEVEASVQEVLAQGPQWQTQLQTQAEQTVSQLDQVEQQLRSAHDQANSGSVAAGEQAVAEVAQGASGVNLSAEELQAIISEMRERLRTDHETAGEQAATGLKSHGDGVLEQLGQVPEALRQDGEQAATTVREGITRVDEGLSREGSQATGALTGALEQVRSSGDQAIQDMSGKLQGSLTEIETELGGHLETFRGGLEERLAPAMEEARKPLEALPGNIDQAFSKVDSELASVEEEEGGLFSWLGRQFSSLWDIVSDPGFVAGAIAGIALTALAIVLAPVELGVLAMIAVGSAIAAVSAVVGMVVHNAFQGKTGAALFDGALQAAAVAGLFGGAAALITGLLGVGAAAVAALTATTAVLTVITNLATGQPWDQNLLANTLMAGVGAWLAGRLARGRAANKDVVPDEVAEVQPGLEDAPEVAQEPPARTRPAKPGSEEAPLDASGRVAERSDGSFRLNRKAVENAHKIEGEPEATNAVDANREVVAAEQAAARANVDRVIMGEQADALVNNGVTGEKMSADVIGVTRDNKFTVSEAKGGNIEHGLEQLEYTGGALGREQVVRYDLVVSERINSPGYTVENGALLQDGRPVLIHGKPVHVTYTTQ